MGKAAARTGVDLLRVLSSSETVAVFLKGSVCPSL